MNAPVVSVLLTTYNRESFLAAAIESVLCQTYTDFELLIVEKLRLLPHCHREPIHNRIDLPSDRLTVCVGFARRVFSILRLSLREDIQAKARCGNRHADNQSHDD